jgi:hypothetical protein
VPCDAKEVADALEALEPRISVHAVPDDATDAEKATDAEVPLEAVDPAVVFQGTQFPEAAIVPADATDAALATEATVPDEAEVAPVVPTEAKEPKDAADNLPGYMRICWSSVPELERSPDWILSTCCCISSLIAIL